MAKLMNLLHLVLFHAFLFFNPVSTQVDDRGPFLLVTVYSGSSSGVYKVDPESGSSTRLPLPTGTYPWAVAYKEATQTVFWSDQKNGFRISEAGIDGTGYTLLSNSDASSILYDAAQDTLFFTGGSNEIRSLVRSTGTEAKIADAFSGTQLYLDTKQRRLYFTDTTARNVMESSVTGAGSKALFTKIDVRGISIDTSGEKVYAGNNNGGLSQYSLASGALVTHILPSGLHVYRLEVSSQHLYILDFLSDIIWRANLTDLGTWQKVFEVVPGSHLGGMTFVNPQPPACPQQPTFNATGPVIAEASEATNHYAVVTSVPVVVGSQCRLVGDNETMTTFTARLNKSSCSVYLRPRQQLDYSKRERYNFTLLLEGLPNCQAHARLSGEVRVSPPCLTISDARRPGDVAVDVSVKYAGSGQPLAVRLREDLRGAHPQFALANTRSSALDNATGETTTQVLLTTQPDHNGRQFHRFTVELSFCAKVEVTNSNSPVFIYPNDTYGSTVLWPEKRTGLLTQVQATDQDTGKFGTAGLRYVILRDPAGHFHINDTTGFLSVVKSLDREALPNIISVIVEVRDNEGVVPFNKAISALHVMIQEINEHSPSFSKAQYVAEILEVSPVGLEVLRVSATDDDVGLSGNIVYTLTNRTAGAPFTVEPSTGHIKVSHKLWGRAGTFSFMVTATDKGIPPLSASVPVRISIRSISSISGRRRRSSGPRQGTST